MSDRAWRERVRARPLGPGATLAVISPAGSPKGDRVEAGIAHLQALGYRTQLGEHALEAGPLYYAGRMEDRLRDLHRAFADPAVDAIVCTRGGWGSAELLPHLDRDLIAAHPKPFIGYSDATSLHTWLANETGVVTFYGPMVAADFALPDGADRMSWAAALGGEVGWSLGPEHGLRVLQPGRATGTLHGGCLAILAESLGTPYAARPRGGVLFLEDIHTKPYQWDRMLLHLRFAGLLEGVAAIVFGDMAQCIAPEQEAFLDRVLLHALQGFNGPILTGLRCGHVTGGNVTLPLGVRVDVAADDPQHPRMHFPEPATAR